MRITCIVEDMIASNLLTTSSRATYIRCIIVGKMMVKHQGLLPLYDKLGNDAPAAKTLGTTTRVDPRLYISSEEDMPFMILAADAFVMYGHKPAPFHANTFYSHALALLDELLLHCLKQYKERYATHALFLDT